MTAIIDDKFRMPAPARDQLSEAEPLSDHYAERETATGDLCGTAE